jgi:hypothetical protein
MIVARHEVPGKASPQKNRPVGYGPIGRSNPMVLLEAERQIFKFELGSFILRHRIGARTCTHHTVPYGTALLGVVVFQALRARLRSPCPSGTKTPISADLTPVTTVENVQTAEDTSCLATISLPLRDKSHSISKGVVLC